MGMIAYVIIGALLGWFLIGSSLQEFLLGGLLGGMLGFMSRFQRRLSALERALAALRQEPGDPARSREPAAQSTPSAAPNATVEADQPAVGPRPTGAVAPATPPTLHLRRERRRRPHASPRAGPGCCPQGLLAKPRLCGA